MKVAKKIFYFLSGVHFALILIATTAFVVIVGTFLESSTNSHHFAAQWTYAHPFFNFLLVLFFINILFSTLRRWPFKKKHIPFLITHLGLLMIISGTFIKNRFGIQGHLSIWEGSGAQHLILPDSYALLIEKNEGIPQKYPQTFIPLADLNPHSYAPSHFHGLSCHLLGSVEHVTTLLKRG